MGGATPLLPPYAYTTRTGTTLPDYMVSKPTIPQNKSSPPRNLISI